MPLPSVHYRLGALALEEWSERPRSAPFDLLDQHTRNAFWQGTLGPDTGLFPGGEPSFALLAHHERTGELTRVLLASASTDAECAFAWGWLTHLLADVAIHPLINRYARRLAFVRGDDPEDPQALAAAHSRYEVGLDVHVHARDAGVRRLRLRHAFERDSIEYLARAFEATYGVAIDRAALLRSHRAVTRMANLLRLLERVHTLAAPAGARRELLCALGAVAAPRLDVVSRAFLAPLPSPRPLLAALRATESHFRELVRRHQADGLADLGNPDLDGLEVYAPALALVAPAA